MLPVTFRVASPSCSALRTLGEASPESMNLEMMTLDTTNKTCNLKCLQLLKFTLEALTVASLIIVREENTETYKLSKILKTGLRDGSVGKSAHCSCRAHSPASMSSGSHLPIIPDPGYPVSSSGLRGYLYLHIYKTTWRHLYSHNLEFICTHII